MKNALAAQQIFSLIEINEIPDFEEYLYGNDPIWIEEGTQFNHALIEHRQIHASQIKELRDLIIDYDIPDYPIIFCQLSNMLGATYLEGDVRWPLMFIDSLKAESPEHFRETYLHEAAHLASNGQDHDFAFAVTNNFLRMKTGLLPSDSDYDHRMCVLDEGQSLTEFKILSALTASMSIKSSWTLENTVGFATYVGAILYSELVTPNALAELFDKFDRPRCT